MCIASSIGGPTEILLRIVDSKDTNAQRAASSSEVVGVMIVASDAIVVSFFKEKLDVLKLEILV